MSSILAPTRSSIFESETVGLLTVRLFGETATAADDIVHATPVIGRHAPLRCGPAGDQVGSSKRSAGVIARSHAGHGIVAQTVPLFLLPAGGEKVRSGMRGRLPPEQLRPNHTCVITATRNAYNRCDSSFFYLPGRARRSSFALRQKLTYIGRLYISFPVFPRRYRLRFHLTFGPRSACETPRLRPSFDNMDMRCA